MRFMRFSPGDSKYLGKKPMPHLEKADIKYLDYSSPAEKPTCDRIIGDGHPTAKAYHAVAAGLAKDFGILDENSKDYARGLLK